MSQLWTMTLVDLRQRVRDRSVIIFAILVPLALMFVLNLVIPSQNSVLAPVTVAASVPDDDLFGNVIIEVLSQVQGIDVSIEAVDADMAWAMAENGTATVGLIIPDGFSRGLETGRAQDVSVIKGDNVGIGSDVLVSIVSSAVGRINAGSVAAQASVMLGVPSSDLSYVAEQVAQVEPTIQLAKAEAAAEQLDVFGALVAGQAGLFVLFTVGYGVLALVTEREQGTLARLRSMPIASWQIVGAKALTSCILGVVATTALLVAGSLFFGVDFGSLFGVAALVLAVSVAATSLMFIIVKVATTSDQAGSAQSIVAMVLGVAGGAFFPLGGSGWYLKLLELNPVSAFMRGLGITAGGGGLSDIGVPLVIMAAFAVVAVAISWFVPDRGSEL